MKKTLLIVFVSALSFAVIVILVTCSLFDDKTVEVNPDWQKLVKNSCWNYSSGNIISMDSLVTALQTVKTVEISNTYTVTINYSDSSAASYSFNAGTLSFSTDNCGLITLRQAGSEGYVTNNVTVSFSGQKDYTMTFEIEGLGKLYFFKNSS